MKWADRNCPNTAAARAQYYPYKIPLKSESKNNVSVSSSSRRTPSFWLNLCSHCFCTSSTILEPSVTEKNRRYDYGVLQNTLKTISLLKEKLIQCSSDPEAIAKRLDENADSLFDERFAFVHLLIRLRMTPKIGVVVFDWRRRKESSGFPLREHEYVQGIVLAGRIKSVDQAKKLFDEAAGRNMRSPIIYNALMTAYMLNNRIENVLELFDTFGAGDPSCRPTNVTYTILIAMFGNLMLVDRMETVFRAVYRPNAHVYNALIAGYLSSWMWDRMELTYAAMGAAGVRPDDRTHALMVRGYGSSGQIEKMEEMYGHARHDDIELIFVMVHAHCRSSRHDRLKKITELMPRLPGRRLYLTVLLVGIYAKQDMVVEMESLIDEAIRTGVVMGNAVMMRVIGCYYRCREVDRLARFVSRVEVAGWPVFRSLYHCKMVMYSLLGRVGEVKGVLEEMRRARVAPTRKTFLILLKVYSKLGLPCQVLGLMVKLGYDLP